MRKKKFETLLKGEGVGGGEGGGRKAEGEIYLIGDVILIEFKGEGFVGRDLKVQIR